MEIIKTPEENNSTLETHGHRSSPWYSGSKATRWITGVIIFSMLAPMVFVFSPPKKAEAQFGIPTVVFEFIVGAFTGTSAGTDVAELGLSFRELAKEIAKEIVRNITRRLLQQMTLSTINWINNGFHGSPLFLENPGSFFRDIAKYEVRTFIDTIGRDSVRFPYGRDYALNTIYAYQRQFEDNAQYTLSKVINDPVLLASYRTDFYAGGWNAFLINTQYPQNNYIGFQLIAADEIARRIDGTYQNNADKVTETLQQGLGFLSPQTCLDNGGDNEYNQTIANQFRRPKFNFSEYNRNNPFDPPDGVGPGDPLYDEYEAQWDADLAQAIADWETRNTCNNLAATTPGSVVASQISNALLSPTRQGELNYLLGNSISAILDALFNKFAEDGLSALATRINRPPTLDDWDYYGTTLGGPRVAGTNTEWNQVPDEVVIVEDFKKQLLGRTLVVASDGTITEEIGDTGEGEYIPGDIKNTETELKLINNTEDDSGENPGLFQVITEIWRETRTLDMCTPGPDLNWQERLREEKTKNDQQIHQAATKGDDEDDTAARGNVVLRELQYAINFYRDFVEDKMLRELDSSVLYIDAIEELDTLTQQAGELTRLRRLRTQALARIQSIEAALRDADFDSQPAAGSEAERALVKLRKQYLATRLEISNSFTIEDRANELAIAKNKFFNIQSLTEDCNTERVDAGWTVGRSETWGWDSTLDGGFNEKELFCDLPIVSGHPHEMFDKPLNTGYSPTPGYKHIPLLSAARVLTWDKWFWGTGDDSASIEINCSYIFNASIIDYKGDLPGFTPVVAQKPEWTNPPTYNNSKYIDNNHTPGRCTGSGIYSGAVDTANKAVLSSNSIASEFNTTDTSYRFLALVVAQLQANGYNATDQVLNGNSNPNTGDIIAVWKSGDTTMERYDIINSSGAGNLTMVVAAQVGYEGTIPLNCTSSGGGTSCACDTTTTPPPTTPPPTPPGPAPASLLSDVITEREKYGTPMSPGELGTLLNTVAWNNRGAGWGLSRKNGGNNCPSPVGNIACDILHHAPTNRLYDVFGSAETLATPQWSSTTYHGDPSGRPWVAPVAP